MSVNSKMTAIADGIRALNGGTAALGLDAMATALGVEKTNVESALAAIAEKGVTVPTGSKSDALASLIAMITGGALVKVGSIVSGYTQNTLDIKSAYPKYAEITVDDIYLVPATFTITQDGTITGGTYNLNKSYDPATGTLTAWRDSVPGQVGLNFNADVYVYNDDTEAGGGGSLPRTTIYASGSFSPSEDINGTYKIEADIGLDIINDAKTNRRLSAFIWCSDFSETDPRADFYGSVLFLGSMKYGYTTSYAPSAIYGFGLGATGNEIHPNMSSYGRISNVGTTGIDCTALTIGANYGHTFKAGKNYSWIIFVVEGTI